MRLTLRTLLAYLDDVLEGEDARDLGEKVRSSEQASELVQRIKSVLRKRRLTAPGLGTSSDSLDPNLVAEYLDNTLPPQKVAEVERVCLESEVHLAEAAACHQILTLVLGEPIEIPPTTRQRMYALGITEGAVDPTMAAAASDPAIETPPPAAEPVRPAATPATEPSPARFEDRLPTYMRRKPFWKRVLPALVVLLGLAVWVGLLARDESFWLAFTLAPEEQTEEDAAQGDGAPEVALAGDNAAGANGADDGSDQPLPDPVPRETPLPVEPDQPAGDDIAMLPPNIDPPPPADRDVEAPLPADIEAADPAESPEMRNGDNGENAPPDPMPAGAAVAKVDAPEAQPVADPDVPAGRDVEGQYTSESGVAFRFDKADSNWYLLPRRAKLRPGDLVAVAPPFEQSIQFDGDAIRATVLEETRFTMSGPSEAADYGLTFDVGRVILESGNRILPDEEPLRLSIAAGDDEWRLDLLSRETVCAVEVGANLLDASLAGRVQAETADVILYVQSGSVRFARGDGEVEMVGAGESHVLHGDPATSEKLGELPEWLSAESRRASLVRERFGPLFEREFDYGTAQPVTFSLQGTSRNSRPMVAAFAASSLGMLEAYPALARIMATSDHEEARGACVRWIRFWMKTGRVKTEQIVNALQREFSADDAQIILRLLSGYSPADGRDPGTSRQLIDWLNNGHLVIRELAIGAIESLTGRTYDYRPMAPATQRQTAVHRWQSHLDREGGALLAGE